MGKSLVYLTFPLGKLVASALTLFRSSSTPKPDN